MYLKPAEHLAPHVSRLWPHGVPSSDGKTSRHSISKIAACHNVNSLGYTFHRAFVSSHQYRNLASMRVWAEHARHTPRARGLRCGKPLNVLLTCLVADTTAFGCAHLFCLIEFFGSSRQIYDATAAQDKGICSWSDRSYHP